MSPDLENYFKFSPFFVNATGMSELEWERLQDKIDQLPQVAIDFLMDYKTAQVFRQLTLESGLTIQQINQLLEIVRGIVVGNSRLESLAAALGSLGIDPVTTRDLARKIITALPMQKHIYPGQDLPETGGNIIDLRK